MYTSEQLETLAAILESAPLSIMKLDIYSNKVKAIKCYFENLSIEDNKLFVLYKETQAYMTSIKKYRLKYILDNLNRDIKCNNKTLINMKSYIESSDKKFGPALREFLDGGLFIIDNSKPLEDEIEWLEKHVRRIRAQVPTKLVKAFDRQFPGQVCESRKDQWAFGFTLFFDEVDNVPQSLLSIKNKNGNSINLEDKSFSNTSYIARLVKAYPDKFRFGCR